LLGARGRLETYCCRCVIVLLESVPAVQHDLLASPRWRIRGAAAESTSRDRAVLKVPAAERRRWRAYRPLSSTRGCRLTRCVTSVKVRATAADPPPNCIVGAPLAMPPFETVSVLPALIVPALSVPPADRNSTPRSPPCR
jgi:hypothetical protein